MMKRIPITVSIIFLLTTVSACTLVISPRPETAAIDNTPTATETSEPPTDTPSPTNTLTPVLPAGTPSDTPAPTDTPAPVAPAATATPFNPQGYTAAQMATMTAAALGIFTPTAPPATDTPTPRLTAPVPPTATATPAVPPTATLPSPPPPPPSGTGTSPTVTEGSITINTADYEPAFIPTAFDDPVYPYPRLDHTKVGPPSPKTYRTLVLENRYTQLTILPDLGGRIYKWIDKTSGRNLFYQNPVITPTQWGNRGWWLATGGMEWALPTDEHGLSEASPWDFQTYQDDQNAGVVLHNSEARTGLETEIIVSLDAEHNYFTVIPRIFNPNAEPVSYKFWINGMFTLGAATLTPGIEFVLPTGSVTVHSTGNPSLPQPGETMSWPVFNGRDFSRYDNWTNYLGVFAAPQARQNFMGAYNHSTNLGVARIFPADVVAGAKIFGLGDLDPALWTNDGSRYFELWGGLAPTFWDENTLNPGDWVTWQERWYAVGDMGGFRFANDEAALNLGLTADSVQVAAISTHPVAGTLILASNGAEVTRWGVSLSPTQPFRGSFTPPLSDVSTANWSLALVDTAGNTLATLGDAVTVANISPPPTGVPPVPTSPAATPFPPATPTVNDGSLVWDPRLDELNIKLTRAQPEPGKPVYRLVAARYLDENESDNLHHIFMEVIDPYGRRILNVPVVMAWADGQATEVTEDKPSPEYAANFPMYDYLGKYSAYVDGAPSDIVSGMGLPGHRHVSFLLTFQQQYP